MTEHLYAEKVNYDVGDLFVKRIRYRLFKQNKNWLCAICGDTGSGKSYTGLSLADLIVPRGITARRNVVFSPVQFLEKLNDGTLQKGDILIFDEAGVGMAAREWYTVQNKLISSVLQTFRHMNIGVIFTTPNLGFIDSHARKLFHSYMETSYIDYKKNLAWVKPYDIQHNSRLDKTYFKAPRFLINGVVRKCGFMGIPKPRPYLIKEYERLKTSYTQKLNADALQTLKGDTPAKPENKAAKVAEIKADILKNKNKYLLEYKKRRFIDYDLIRYDYDLTKTAARAIKKAIEREIL